MKKILISRLAPNELLSELWACGYAPVTLEKSEHFTSELGYHADIAVGVTPSGLVTSEAFFEKNKEHLKHRRVIISKSTPSEEYPSDVVFNGAFVGDALIASKYICEEMKSCAEKIITVKQGYAKCSCAVAKSSIITADVGICRALAKNDIDHLKIDGGGIALRGFSCGFIGGASFFDSDTLFFFGDIKKHKNGSDIVDFLKNINVGVVSLGKDELYDLGGAIVL